MGRPFLEKFNDVKYVPCTCRESHVNDRPARWEVQDGHLKAWEQGRTGFPIVDAAMRQCNQMGELLGVSSRTVLIITLGWMHNRLRMIAAMVMCKTLMLDWRLGERYFMQSFIDGDLASNNGGWQWVASTGCDAQPYFRIMNPYNQSLKVRVSCWCSDKY
jgi:deoxyribodipyrimidine photo-lyase